MMSKPIQFRGYKTPNHGLSGALDAASDGVRQALMHSHRALNELQVPHILVGDLAVGVHGYPHFTEEVNYLVPEDVAFQGSLVVSFRPGIPIRVGSVGIDYLVPSGPEVVQRKMRECLDKSVQHPEDATVAPPELLVYLALHVGRAKDIAAVVELLKAGADIHAIQNFLCEAGNPDVLKRFARCVALASEE